MPDDIVCGEFLGDSALLILSGDGDGIAVTLPIDARSEGYRPAPTLAKFLAKYLEGLGQKYWEPDVAKAGD